MEIFICNHFVSFSVGYFLWNALDNEDNVTALLFAKSLLFGAAVCGIEVVALSIYSHKNK